MNFGIALGALNPHFHLDATMAAEELGYESVWLPEHLVFTGAMTRSPHPGEDHPPVPPTRRSSTRSRTSAYLAGRTERVRLGTHVYNIGLRHPFTTARGAQTVDLLSNGRFEFGIGASWLEQEWDAARTRLRRHGADGSTRHSPSASGSSPRRRSRTTASSSRSTRSCSSRSPGRSRGRRSWSGASRRRRCAGRPGSATAGSGWVTPWSRPRSRSRRSAPCSPSTGARMCRSRSCSEVRLHLSTTFAVGKTSACTRMIVSPWRRSPEAVESMQRFADAVLRPS